MPCWKGKRFSNSHKKVKPRQAAKGIWMTKYKYTHAPLFEIILLSYIDLFWSLLMNCSPMLPTYDGDIILGNEQSQTIVMLT